VAYVNGEWLDANKRLVLINKLKKNIKMFKELMARDEMTEVDYDSMDHDLTLLERLQRVHRGQEDFLYFMYEYFSEDRNPENPANLIPAGQTYETAADFHRELAGLMNAVNAGRTNDKIAWSVGRGHAKTAYLSNGYLAQQVVYRLQKYIVLVSETVDVASDFIQWTTYQLKNNRKLREDFGELMPLKKTINTVDNKNEFVTTSDTKVEAKGVQAQVRGLRHLDTRPGLFLLDDLESKTNTNTPELRQKNKDWFTTEMLPALAQGGQCVYMGTIVHYDSLLNYTIKERRDFTSRNFPAILQWAEREDLWEKWRAIRRSDKEEAAEEAKQFYLENEADMLQGTRVLWPEWYTYLDLMQKREDNGARAFNQEYLGHPIDEESQVFSMDKFYFYEELPDNLEYFAGIDLAMGKERGDYSAIVVLGKSPNGVFYVVDVYLKRVHPDVFLKDAVKIVLKWQLSGLAVEAQQMQEWFADSLTTALMAHGYPAKTRLKSVKQRNRKELRIESLLPVIENSTIKFSKYHRLLLEMFELYPDHNHDDGPDALHMAYDIANSKFAFVRRSRKRSR
jgi:predicted phage terminase large subunit-like protein